MEIGKQMEMGEEDGVGEEYGKFETVLMEYSGAGGKLIHEKNQKQNIS